MDSSVLVGMFPTSDLISHSSGAEWVRGGWTCTDLSQDVNANDIDFIELLESQKVWESIRMPLLCIICRDPEKEWPTFERVHWSYQSCKTCEDVFVCADCSTTEKFLNLKIQKHSTCSFMHLTVRPLWSPLYDGSDLEQLQSFKSSRTSKEFFVLFPWLFHCFPEFDEMKINYRKTVVPDIVEDTSLEIEHKLAVLQLDRLPTDWFVRKVGRGSWESLLESMMPIIESRIQTASVSTQLCAFLKKLQHYNRQKTESFGNGDIKPLDTSSSHGNIVDAFSGSVQEFIFYSIPLQFLTVLDPYIKLESLRAIRVPQEGTGLEEFLDDEIRRNVGVRSIHSYGGFLDNDNKFKDSVRLWHMFNMIFSKSSGFDELESTFPRIDFSNYLGRLKPEWYGFLARNRRTRISLANLHYETLPEIANNDLSLLSSTRSVFWPEAHKSAALLQKALDLRRRGGYEEAIEMLTAEQDIAGTDLFISLELQATFLAQGNYLKAKDCQQSQPELGATSSIRTTNEANRSQRLALRLLNLISAYAGGFVDGHWSEALQEALEVFENHLTSWQPVQEDVMLIVYLEIYFHRIVLEAARDLHVNHESGSALERLNSISRYLSQCPANNNLAAVAWDVVSVELDLNQRSGIARYLDMENTFSVPSYIYNVDNVVPIVLKFLQSRVIGEDSIQNPAVFAEALIFAANLYLEDGSGANATFMVAKAERLLSALDDTASAKFKSVKHAGLLDAAAFRLKMTGISSLTEFKQLQTLYAELRARHDLRRLRKIRPWNVARAVIEEDKSAHEWAFYQRLSLQELALEAGDMVAYERWKLRKYAGDDQSVTSITDAERMLHEGQVSSNVLGAIATFNLSQAYLRTGNYLEAALNALLHHSLTAERGETEAHQKAILNVLQVYTETVSECKDDCETIIARIATVWNGWLTDGPYARWTDGAPRCDEIDRFIDAACFLPNLARNLGRGRSEISKLINQQLVERMLDHLQTAFDLYETLPTYLASTIIPKLSLAAGAVTVYAGNKELALRMYWEGTRALHSQDRFSRALLQLQAGTLMTLLGQEDPEHWLYVVPTGRGLLSSAAKMFLSSEALAGSLSGFCTAQVSLLASLVCEARERKIEIDKQLTTIEAWRDEENVEQINAIARLWRRAQEPVHFTELIVGRIAQNINFLKPFEASQNLAALSSKRVVLLNRELALEISMIIIDIDEMASDRARGTPMWPVIQRYKGSALHQRYYSQLVPNHVLQAIKDDSVAWKLYTTEQLLMKQGPQSFGDSRLRDNRTEMLENEATLALVNHRSGNLTVNADELGPLEDAAASTFHDLVDVILVDWIQYHDYFLIIGFSVQRKQISFFRMCTEVTVAQVEAWVEEHLRVPRQNLASALWSLEVFKPLSPLVKAIRHHCKPGDLLVFCPSQQLHAIPLHALPYDESSGKSLEPIINVHPVVYAPSNLILKQCVTRVLEERRDIGSAELFGRWGSAGSQSEIEEQRIAESIQTVSTTLQSAGINVGTATGSALTREVLTNSIRTASILHYHGHISDEDLKQHLVLESELKDKDTAISDQSNISHPYYGLQPSRRTDIYTLQDAFANKVQASLVSLLGCGSGTQRISQSDDAMGLITAFLAAGATSVIGTLWPLDSSDASTFSEMFYNEAFTSRGRENGERDLINLAIAYRSTIMEMQACQNPICKKRRSQEKRTRCHPVAAYHWSHFVLWGSWFCGRSPGSQLSSEANPAIEEDQPKGEIQTSLTPKANPTAEATVRSAPSEVEEVFTSLPTPSSRPAQAASMQVPSKVSSTASRKSTNSLFSAAKSKKWLL